MSLIKNEESTAAGRRVVLLVGTGLLTLGCMSPVHVGSVDTPADQPKHGGVLNLAVEEEIADWDPASGQNFWGGFRVAYETVIGYDTRPEVPYSELVLQPRLAERWEVSSDAKTFTFHLRKGVKFADIPPVNGREMTAADVKWSYEYQSRTGQFKDSKLPKAANASLFEALETIETPSSHVVVVRFKEAYAPFLTYAAIDQNPVMPRELLEQGVMKDRPLGTNAFYLDPAASQTGTRTVFKKHPGYWQSGKPYLDEVRFLILPSAATAHAAFQSKQVDLLASVNDIKVAQQIAQSTPGAVQREYQEAPRTLYLNNQRPPLSDVRVRRALSLGVERDVFSRLFGGEWALAGAPNGGVLAADEVKRIQRYDAQEARRLLREAGHSDGVNLEVLVTPGEAVASIFELLQAQLKQVGVNLVLKPIGNAESAPLRRSGDFFIAIAGTRDATDHDQILSTFHSTSNLNYGRVHDAKLDRLIEAQRREADPAKRMEIVREAVRHMNENTVALMLIHTPAYHFWHPWLKNYSPHVSQISGGRVGPSGVLVDSWLDK